MEKRTTKNPMLDKLRTDQPLRQPTEYETREKPKWLQLNRWEILGCLASITMIVYGTSQWVMVEAQGLQKPTEIVQNQQTQKKTDPVKEAEQVQLVNQPKGSTSNKKAVELVFEENKPTPQPLTKSKKKPSSSSEQQQPSKKEIKTTKLNHTTTNQTSQSTTRQTTSNQNTNNTTSNSTNQNQSNLTFNQRQLSDAEKEQKHRQLISEYRNDRPIAYKRER